MKNHDHAIKSINDKSSSNKPIIYWFPENQLPSWVVADIVALLRFAFVVGLGLGLGFVDEEDVIGTSVSPGSVSGDAVFAVTFAVFDVGAVVGPGPVVAVGAHPTPPPTPE